MTAIPMRTLSIEDAKIRRKRTEQATSIHGVCEATRPPAKSPWQESVCNSTTNLGSMHMFGVESEIHLVVMSGWCTRRPTAFRGFRRCGHNAHIWPRGRSPASRRCCPSRRRGRGVPTEGGERSSQIRFLVERQHNRCDRRRDVWARGLGAHASSSKRRSCIEGRGLLRSRGSHRRRAHAAPDLRPAEALPEPARADEPHRSQRLGMT